MVDFSFKMVDFGFNMVDFNFKFSILAPKWPILTSKLPILASKWSVLTSKWSILASQKAGFSFKIVDFNFKMVKMADFISKWPVLVLKADFSFALDPSRVHTQEEPLCKPKCFRATWPGRALDPSRVHTQTASCVQSKAAKNGFWQRGLPCQARRHYRPASIRWRVCALDPSTVHAQAPLCKPRCFRGPWPGRALDPSRVHAQAASCVQSKAAKNGFWQKGFALLGPAGPWTLQGSIPKRRPGASGAFELFQKVVAWSRTQGFGTHTGVPLRIKLWQQSTVVRACAGMSWFFQLHVPIPKSTST